MEGNTAGKRILRLTRMADLDGVDARSLFDLIVLTGLPGDHADLLALFRRLRPHCGRDTRLVIEYYGLVWQIILGIGKNRLTLDDIRVLLGLSGFEITRTGHGRFVPAGIPVLSLLCNRLLARLPLVDFLTLNHIVAARPLCGPRDEMDVTILVPCRNESKNIEQVLTRTPAFGKSQEFIFVEGGSKDGTYGEVERALRAYPGKDIQLLKQPGNGRADAVRHGLAHASGDVLMILDADLTVPPEDLATFYEVIREGRAEFVNGYRRVYSRGNDLAWVLSYLTRTVFGRFFSWAMGQQYRDILCGTKALLRQHYEQMTPKAWASASDLPGGFDLVLGANRLNLKIAEVPVRCDESVSWSLGRWFRHAWALGRACSVAWAKTSVR